MRRKSWQTGGYQKTSFLPGRVFASTSAFNVQLEDWLRPANRDTFDYSLHPLSIGRQIEVKAGLDEVLVFRKTPRSLGTSAAEPAT
ncbi:hypothetical protein ACL07V_36245 [Streptomyces sp. MB22_4]|uniref:hypothetical protein n=1 Tax=Streptomyces sp. MB22_4 TaxID=3383120 RepID=UPI0039A393D9